jgi:DNA modification methylase
MRDGTTDPKLKHHGLKGKEWEENPMKNKRSVWTVNTKGYKGAHFAVYPKQLVLPCILAGCPQDGTVLDPFNGSGTTGVVALQNNRRYIGLELNPEYVKLAEARIAEEVSPLTSLFE